MPNRHRFRGISRRFHLAGLCAFLSAWSHGAPLQRVYLGTYTGGDSKGIYAAPFDPSTGKLGPVEPAAETENPSFLVAEAEGRYLYAVNEADEWEGRPAGGVSVFATERGGPGLRLVQQVSSLGPAPAHLSLDKAGRFLLVANYNGGSVAVFPVDEDGRLGEAAAFVQEAGSSVNPERQGQAHAHFIQTTADNRFALNADLGADKIFLYRFDASSGTLTSGSPPFVKADPGEGPRHLVQAPSGRFVYILNELSSTVAVFSVSSDLGAWRRIQTLSTLPSRFSGNNKAAEIAMDATGRFLYASNRGDDSLAVFRANTKTGRLTPIQRIPSGGRAPRHFAIDPSGRWLLAANQDSDSVQVFRIDPRSGRLTPGGSASAPSPVCVLFSGVLISSETAAVLPSAQEEVGNDPTVLRSRIEAGDEYFNNSGGPDWHLMTLRLDGAPTPRLAFRVDVPFMYLYPQGYAYDDIFGLADVMVRGSGVVKKTARAGFTAYCDLWFDTAESFNFGLGKYSAGPALAVALMNPYKDLMWSSSLQHKFSYAGDSSRPDISRTRLDVVMDKSVRERYWMVVNPVVYVDWANEGRSAGVFEVELGARLGGHWNAWARPGVGLWGQEVSGGYNGYLQAGVRYIFGRPLRKQLLEDFGLARSE